MRRVIAEAANQAMKRQGLTAEQMRTADREKVWAVIHETRVATHQYFPSIPEIAAHLNISPGLISRYSYTNGYQRPNKTKKK